ncbi:MAG TPA: OB-fold nucleic acid binding domain-containing protein [Candidatus Nanoarchaeia archaeon]|nr:OB-fold nucleic acid binding domain-containing protein [Candidatus Nanoarchaeia archaeon]
MEDKLIIKLCVFTTILGLILLVIISNKLEAPTKEISQISKKDINKSAKITGFVKKIMIKTTVATITLEDKTGTIQVVMFKPENLKIKTGSLVEIEGKISLYEDQIQVYAEKVKILNQ